MTTPTVTSSAHVPFRERINVRLIVFVAILVGLLGIPIYLYLDSVVSGGIKHVGDGLIEVDLKAMSTFSFDQKRGTVDEIPPKWRELDGKRITTIGEMWKPDSVANYVSDFELVYSVAKCCFSGPPQVQHFVHSTVKTPQGVVPYIYGEPVRVIGTLHVNVKRADGRVQSVYQLEVEKVERAS